ncbi:alpha/beta fold hydrolase [Paraburkholderia sp. HD33-4]|uniref:alpha/beta fold hydrolase n=1 Tax=Paraburkholderia sp. HD33-4 TaxID=2883242 RepID=UPI001F46DC98|nr:alpha/beta fold hydrolase [Paraburkholderia sp. HD33-4]
MNALEFALIAQESYTAAPDIGVAASASRAIVRLTDAGLVVAFPGSDNGECWEADFDIDIIDVPGIGKVHRGFWNAWVTLSDAVVAAIADRPVIFVGHSLGAAIAVCAAAALTVEGKPPIAVYGFEPPRVSPETNIAAILATVPVALYRNGLDIVPDVPFYWQLSAPLIQIGKPELPFPNTLDHSIVKVIDALTTSQEATT